MKKILLSLLLLVVIVLGAVYFFGSTLLNKGVKSGVETFGPKVTQTSVQLDTVSLSILSGDGRLEGLYIGNPEGYKAENIFALGRVDVDMEPMSVFDDVIVINKVHILQPEISYEKGLRGSNLQDLMANIEEFTGPKEPGAEPPPADAKPGKKILIKSLVIEDGSIYLGLLGQGAKVPLPRIEMSDLGAKEDGSGQNPAEVVGAVIAKILQSVTQILANPEMIKELGGTALDAAGSLKDAGGSLKDAGGSAAEGAGKAVEGIRNLFGN
jgi:hypothetical protein